MVASPEPQMALTLLKGLTTTTLGTTIGAIIGPVLGLLSPFISAFGPFSSSLGVLDLASAGGSGFGAGAGAGSATYFSGNSETMSLFADTLAFSVNDAS